MKLEDALFNWLQIRLVADARPDDNAAMDTVNFFAEILSEDHGLTHFEISKIDDSMVHVRYDKEGRSKLQLYPREAAEQLLSDIESNPKYN
ncbi:hypothetical protein L1N85_12970 [Paenibacillus alkaliterrae]|uniref:hypothetical protein n=1 Tax=Paenibacillus alkaliterrae TaxID=320909 RepID=UPI001F31AAEE|nr:hypothetical protein [Paenibacillus alkaliterrae]MCF2939339.1 hypothetical protein [Paenibacillus alkaliterrae]